MYLYRTSWLIACLAAAIVALLGLTSIILPIIVPLRIARRMYTICATTLTHAACALMLHAVIAAWIVVHTEHWFFYTSAIIALFYYIFAQIGEPSRLIRHPPTNFRKPS